MFKKTIFVSVLTFSILCFSSIGYSDQYYLQYSGNSFQPEHEISAYVKSDQSYIYDNDTSTDCFFCPVNFSVPDGSTYFIKSIGVRYLDNLSNGYVGAYLLRKNLYTGNRHTVVAWQSTFSEASSSDKTASKGTNAGYKLVDTKKFVYYLYIYFWRNGDFNPSSNLKIHQVRIHYGT